MTQSKADTVQAQPSPEIGIIERLSRFLFGNDAFISYSRSDASSYALALANELTKQGLTCFLDQWGTPPGDELPPKLKKALRRSSMLVLIGTSEAACSIPVKSEVDEFLKTERTIIPITFEDSLQKAPWFASVRGIALTVEKKEALQTGKPSENVITRIVNAEGFTRRDKKLRRTFLLIAISVIVLIIAGAVISLKLTSDIQKQQKAVAASRLLGTAISLQDKQPDLALGLTLESNDIANKLDNNTSEYAKSTLLELLVNKPHLNGFLYGNTEEGTSLAFSRDGRKLASGNLDGTVTVWDVDSKKLIPSPTGNLSTVESLAFTPDGNLIACGAGDGIISIWNESLHAWDEQRQISSETVKTTETDVTGSISALDFSPDGKTLAIGRCAKWDNGEESEGGGNCIGGELIFLEFSTHKILFSVFQHKSAPRSIAYNPDGKTLISTSSDSIVIWDLAKRQVIKQIAAQSNVEIRSATYDKNSKVIASGTRQNSIIIWDANNDKEIVQPLVGHAGSISSVALSPDGATVASSGDDKNIILWNVSSWGIARRFIENIKTDTITVSPDGKLLATGRDEVISLWDIDTSKPFASLQGHASIIRSMDFSPDNKKIASPTRDGGILLWDLTSNTPTPVKLHGKHNFVWSIKFNPDGKSLAAANDDGTISLWNISTYEESILPVKAVASESASPAHDVAFSPDGKILAVAINDYTESAPMRDKLVLWNLTSSEQIDLFPTEKDAGINAVAFSPDGKKIAASCSSKFQHQIMLWDVLKRLPIRESLTVNDDFGGGLAFNNDGTLITWVDTKGVVKLWHTDSEQIFARIPFGESGIDQNLAFTPGGQLITYNRNGLILFWDMDPNLWIKRACNITNRNLTEVERLNYSIESKNNKICEY